MQTLQTLQLKRRGCWKGKANGFAGKSGTSHCSSHCTMTARHLGLSIWTPARSTSAVREVAAEQKLQQKSWVVLDYLSTGEASPALASPQLFPRTRKKNMQGKNSLSRLHSQRLQCLSVKQATSIIASGSVACVRLCHGVAKNTRNAPEEEASLLPLRLCCQSSSGVERCFPCPRHLVLQSVHMFIEFSMERVLWRTW